MFRKLLMIAVVAGATSQVYAQEAGPAEPAKPAAALRAATPAPPPADAKAISDAPAVAPAPAEQKASSLTEGEMDADTIMAMQKAGYKIKNENGKILLCRRDVETGSRLRRKLSCMTPREWEQLEEDNKLQLKSLERRPRMSRP